MNCGSGRINTKPLSYCGHLGVSPATTYSPPMSRAYRAVTWPIPERLLGPINNQVIFKFCFICLSSHVPPSGHRATGHSKKKMAPKLSTQAKFALMVVAVHVVQIVSERLYYTHCSRRFFMSLFTRGSPMCSTLRGASDTLSQNFNKIVAGGLLVALQHPLNKLLEGSMGAPAELVSSV